MVTVSLDPICTFQPQKYVILLMMLAPEEISSAATWKLTETCQVLRGNFCYQVNFLLSCTTRHTLKLQSVSNTRERCPSLSSEMNNHISTQIKGDLINVGGPRRAWQGREAGIFNLEECALNKTDKKQRKKRKRKKAHKQLYSYIATLSALQWRGYNFFVTFTFIFPKYCIPCRST